ncbi:MAG: esterase [Bryobacterales bacterium]|nr:esterase [Bryobacterales bacterium]
MKIYTLLLAAAACFAQNPPAPADTLVSPEVRPNRTVTFRIHAPRASEVTFFGDWMPANSREKMTRDAAGVWSVTLGPLPPSVYLYSFNVDGMTIADPVNPRIKLRARTSASMVEVPAETPAFWQVRDVPHGDVQINYRKSKALNGETRWIWIYTPPGYEKSNRRYPVLYLFHGSNDTAGGWVLAGHANFILDNLIAEKKAEPMIVVMPYGHAVPFGSPREVQARNVVLYDQYIVEDVIPHVESKYRVAPGKANRAIAGLSMGGGQSIHIGFSHLDLFSAIGAFSAAVPADFETRFAAALKDPKSTNAQLKTLWIACGKDDFLIKRNQDFSALLKSRQIRHTFELTEGAHTYTVWRRYLGEFAPLLFR